MTGIALLVLAVAIPIGWHAFSAWEAHQGIGSRRAQLRGLRQERTRALVWVVPLSAAVIVIIVITAS